MLPPSHYREHLEFDGAPVVDDTRIAESHHEIAPCHQCAVPSSITFSLFGTRVPRVAVELEHEPISDNEIDATDPSNRDLDARRETGRTKPKPPQGLQSRFAASIGRLERLRAPDSVELEGEAAASRDPEIERGIYGADRLLERQTSDGHTESREGIVDSIVRVPRQPMYREEASVEASLRGHPGVRLMPERPDSVFPESGFAGQRATTAHGGDHLRRSSGRGVPTRPNAQEVPLAHESRDVGAARTRHAQLTVAGD